MMTARNKLRSTNDREFSKFTVADPAVGWGGARNMKSMRPNSAAIFFMTYFYRGAWHPRPPGSATDSGNQIIGVNLKILSVTCALLALC